MLFLLSTPACLAQTLPGSPDAPCGEVIGIATHDRSTTRYAYVAPPIAGAQGQPTTLLLLAGGSGHVDLDDKACPRGLKGNSLVRSIPLFGAAGLGTALVDAVSDHHGEDGLGGFRIAAQHAEDIGLVVADLRTRTQGAVWLVGTSRGAISAMNAAARLSGPFAADGLVITSAVTVGDSAARKKWVSQTVFDLPLEDIRLPLLLVGHRQDKCIRSPPDLMEKIVARTRSRREQIVTVAGGPSYSGVPGILACEGSSPHGFSGQEAELVAGISRFVRGGSYHGP
jgi:hypothetical protein